MEKVLKIDRPGGRRGLKFDSRAAAEGCGIAHGATAWQGSKGSEGS